MSGSAAARYARQYRAANPRVNDRRRELTLARRHAVAKLIERYPAEFDALLRQECATMGIEPPRGRWGRTS